MDAVTVSPVITLRARNQAGSKKWERGWKAKKLYFSLRQHTLPKISDKIDSACLENLHTTHTRLFTWPEMRYSHFIIHLFQGAF